MGRTESPPPGISLWRQLDCDGLCGGKAITGIDSVHGENVYHWVVEFNDPPAPAWAVLLLPLFPGQLLPILPICALREP